MSDEEWEAIRPTKLERRDYLLQNIRVSENKCNKNNLQHLFLFYYVI